MEQEDDQDNIDFLPEAEKVLRDVFESQPKHSEGIVSCEILLI